MMPCRCGLASSDASTALLTRFRKLAERRQQLHQQAQHYSSSSEPVLAAFAAGVSTILSKQCAAVQAVCTMVQACYGVQPGGTSASLLAVISHLDRLVSQVSQQALWHAGMAFAHASTTGPLRSHKAT